MEGLQKESSPDPNVEPPLDQGSPQAITKPQERVIKRRNRDPTPEIPEKMRVPEGSKRKRKIIPQEELPSLPPPPELVIPKGEGTPLGDIPNIRFRLKNQYEKSDPVLRLLHRVLFKTPGREKRRKKNIMAFSGFGQEENPVAERDKRIEKMNRWTVEQLRSVCRLFDVSTTGAKAELIHRLLVFLQKPEKLTERLAADTEPAFRPGKRSRITVEEDGTVTFNVFPSRLQAMRGKATSLPPPQPPSAVPARPVDGLELEGQIVMEDLNEAARKARLDEPSLLQLLQANSVPVVEEIQVL
jgi:hypothetical protein